VETFSNFYLAVSGCPVARDDHCELCVDAAIQLLGEAHSVERPDGMPTTVRVGLNTVSFLPFASPRTVTLVAMHTFVLLPLPAPIPVRVSINTVSVRPPDRCLCVLGFPGMLGLHTQGSGFRSQRASVRFVWLSL